MARTALKVTSERMDDDLVVAVDGDVDFGNSPTLRVQLREALDQQPRRLIIDLHGVTFMDSSGVATLVEMLQSQLQSQQKLILCNLQPKVHSLLRIVRLDAVFKIAQDLAQARQM